MTERIRVAEWDRVVDELRRFGRRGTVTVDDDRVRVEFGSAQIEVTRDGQVVTGMPLHDFERSGDVVLVVDHDAGELTVESESGDEDGHYTFRRPGG